ncbi:hypothetical protein KGA66_10175 [Actinocrinis puniceicyclus]|uniref:Uncharacterized protein n=1 Tax=Actinocrinis puniceicyclus TaxID=977794 RepID=A0A8J8BBS3_9ACTN|nr:hypothetical protein [Actinocrinis puniceicyclus]MBS2963413.1 hypothetical protein [Actinocrinis puniceicyclus]
MTARLRALSTTVAALAFAGLAAPAASAAPIQDPIAVGPNMYFTAAVNPGSPTSGTTPTIEVVCPGPVALGQTGHPVSGQYLEAYTVLPPTSTAVGFTGSAADQIDALFTGTSVATTANPPVVITSFFVKVPIPTSLNLPCGGSGIVSFVPIPTSSTARGYPVKVQYLNIAV